MDSRALAVGILKFVVLLAFFALMYGVLNQFALDLFGDLGQSAPSQEVGELQGYAEAAWIALPAIVLFALAARLVARAVFESRGGVR